MENVTIKAIQIKDEYKLVSEMMAGLHKNEQGLHDKTAAWSDIETSYMRHIITAQEENDGICAVAYVGNEPAGFIFGYTEEQDDSRIEVYKGVELYVSDGYIAEPYRRMGIYRQLNQYLERVYIEKGVQRITRFTLVNNTRMRQFLEEEGYEVTRLLYEKWMG